jgi:hypothetical protein
MPVRAGAESAAWFVPGQVSAIESDSKLCEWH